MIGVYLLILKKGTHWDASYRLPLASYYVVACLEIEKEYDGIVYVSGLLCCSY